LERRRCRAVQLLEQGAAPAAVARILGVKPTSLHRWRRVARQGQGLEAKPATGAKRRLTDLHLLELDILLRQGATAHGFPNQMWTSARVALVMQRCFGIKYHPDHALQLLKQRLHWTCHKPQKRARNDKEVERRKADEFPRILRDAWRRAAHIAFLDESGCMLAPLVRRTLAPRGERVKLGCSAKRDKISVISCVTLSPRAMPVGLYYWPLVKRNFQGEEVVEFLQYLTHKLPGEWTVVWDRNKIHKKSKVVRAWLAKHPQVVVEDFPVYDPGSNPDEWVWSWAKYGKLCNLCPAAVEILCDCVMDALAELEHQPALLASFVVSAGVPLCL
jgi:transposase